MHGFAAANVSRGAGVIVVSELSREHAKSEAERIARRLFAVRNEIVNKPLSIEEAIQVAENVGSRPVVIAEGSDNPGGGGAGDATWLLQAMLAANLGRSLFGMLCDPGAIVLAKMVEAGRRMPLRIGGKAGPRSGPPLDVDATIVDHHAGLVQTSFAGREDLGPACTIRVGQTDILLVSKRQQVLDPSCFRAAGLEPADYNVIGVKSNHHFHAGFRSLAPIILYANHAQPGTQKNDRLWRPAWPLDATPFELDGVLWE